ncbi:hypothetical protein HMPREF9630_00502 [Peptoanaerobacter stomatis]|jgi:hypothetical protein|uniref:Uncharacterized protein n=1 Tax=Peptoanaerobacter stomatis TaxID=796937 RepID=G9WZ76_9FIRM|nr:hypothetical protein [Peptoanaerobacter stomatis]NWO24692.1 hypothetical protein [Peptostreptococcaceae bacterium oral taxon 081]EHL16052.1 hypothetical protein HMPREF9629_01477 [Peptoanaerobacter stomatis]EHL17335.1 hypothetical protein HMPREF9630_00502 [Peptoanaerobacter stomatis]EHL20047.1 hypothetical protein HMPREF9628_01044 [Peptoanaerobacter stomatis]EJU21458.1 hypothetical protein HMPREF1143_0298 [Peptoanaerobacter stomatis]
MFDFNKITIDQLSKTDLLAILQALDYTYEHTKIEQFLSLKDSIVTDMCKIADIKSQEDLIEVLMK